MIEDSPTPEPVVEHAPAAHTSSNIKEVWTAAGDSEDEQKCPPQASTSRKVAREVIEVSSDSEEESRYEIPGPSSKRRRLGTRADAHSVFTADSDDDVHDSSDSEGEELRELVREEGEYTDAETSESDGEADVKRRNKRAYWAAKAALGVTSVDSD